MINFQSTEIATTYVNAIAAKDIETILSLAADNVTCSSPMGQITGKESFRGFHEGFARMMTNLSVRVVLGDESQAVVVYDIATHPVPHAVTVELLKFQDGKIISTEVVYDAMPFAAFMATLPPQ